MDTLPETDDNEEDFLLPVIADTNIRENVKSSVNPPINQEAKLVSHIQSSSPCIYLSNPNEATVLENPILKSSTSVMYVNPKSSSPTSRTPRIVRQSSATTTGHLRPRNQRSSCKQFCSLKRPTSKWRRSFLTPQVSTCGSSQSRLSSEVLSDCSERLSIRRHSDTMLGKSSERVSRTEPCPHRPVVIQQQVQPLLHSQSSKERRSGLDCIGADFLRINGAVSGFKQLKRAEEFITSKQSSVKQHSTSLSSGHQGSQHYLETSLDATSISGVKQQVCGELDITSSQPGSPLQSGDSQIRAGSGYKFQKSCDSAEQNSHHKRQEESAGFRLGQRKELFEKRKRISDYSLAFAFFGLFVMVLETEMTMAKVYEKTSVYSIILKTLISISTMVLLTLVIGYHVLEIKLFSCDDCIEDWRIAITWQRIAQLVLEILVCSVHPIPGDFRMNWSIYINKNNKTVYSPREISIDLFLSLPMLFRFYLIFRVMLLHSKLFTDAGARSIGAMNKVKFDMRFVLKTLMTICPGTILLVFILSMWIIFSWTLRSCEFYHDDEFANILTSMWLISVTFLSIGYGDVVPHTNCGRSIAIATGVMGSACTALIVAVFARKLELSKAEKHVIHFMMENQLTKRMKNYAANVLRETWLIYKYTKLVKRVNPGKVRSHQRLFLRAIHGLRRIKIDQRKLQDSSNTLVDLAKTQSNIYESVSEIRVDQGCLGSRMEEIENTLNTIQEQLNSIPDIITSALTEQTRSPLMKSSSTS